MELGRSEIEGLIPHAGAMVLLDAVVSWNATHIQCRATSHTRPDHPLTVEGALPALCGLEYAAQAMALHGRLSGVVGTRPRKGYIASVRNVVWRVERLDRLPSPLLIDAELLAHDGSTVLYRFALNAGGIDVVTGRAAVLLEA